MSTFTEQTCVPWVESQQKLAAALLGQSLAKAGPKMCLKATVC